MHKAPMTYKAGLCWMCVDGRKAALHVCQNTSEQTLKAHPFQIFRPQKINKHWLLFTLIFTLWRTTKLYIKKKNTSRTNLDLGQLEDFREGIDAVGVGRQRVQALAVEDGGGHSSQSVAAQVQLLQLLQSSQFTAGLKTNIIETHFMRLTSGAMLRCQPGCRKQEAWNETSGQCSMSPGSKDLQLVVGKVQHPEVAVSRQQGDALVSQSVISHVELLQAAGGVLWQAGCRQVLQLVGRHVQVSQAAFKKKLETNLRLYK